jgi:hypothetical protein
MPKGPKEDLVKARTNLKDSGAMLGDLPVTPESDALMKLHECVTNILCAVEKLQKKEEHNA